MFVLETVDSDAVCHAALCVGLSAEEAWPVLKGPLSGAIRQSPSAKDTCFSDGQWLDCWRQLTSADYSSIIMYRV